MIVLAHWGVIFAYWVKIQILFPIWDCLLHYLIWCFFLVCKRISLLGQINRLRHLVMLTKPKSLRISWDLEAFENYSKVARLLSTTLVSGALQELGPFFISYLGLLIVTTWKNMQNYIRFEILRGFWAIV